MNFDERLFDFENLVNCFDDSKTNEEIHFIASQIHSEIKKKVYLAIQTIDYYASYH
jgi:hypothetical protein